MGVQKTRRRGADGGAGRANKTREKKKRDMEWPRREAGKRRVWVATPRGGQEAGKCSHAGRGPEVFDFGTHSQNICIARICTPPPVIVSVMN